MGEFRNITNSKGLYVCDLAANEQDKAFRLGQWKPVSVMVAGILGRASVLIEGSNDFVENPQFFILNDPQGNSLVFDSPRLESILEDCVQIRIRTSGGSEDTNVRVCLLLGV